MSNLFNIRDLTCLSRQILKLHSNSPLQDSVVHSHWCLLCHKEPAHRIQSPQPTYLLWHKSAGGKVLDIEVDHSDARLHSDSPMQDNCLIDEWEGKLLKPRQDHDHASTEHATLSLAHNRNHCHWIVDTYSTKVQPARRQQSLTTTDPTSWETVCSVSKS